MPIIIIMCMGLCFVALQYLLLLLFLYIPAYTRTYIHTLHTLHTLHTYMYTYMHTYLCNFNKCIQT